MKLPALGYELSKALEHETEEWLWCVGRNRQPISWPPFEEASLDMTRDHNRLFSVMFDDTNYHCPTWLQERARNIVACGEG